MRVSCVVIDDAHAAGLWSLVSSLTLANRERATTSRATDGHPVDHLDTDDRFRTPPDGRRRGRKVITMTDRTELHRARQDVADYIGIPRTTHGRRQHRTISPWACWASRYICSTRTTGSAPGPARSATAQRQLSRADLGQEPSGRSA
jgi:hypothetical protein